MNKDRKWNLVLVGAAIVVGLALSARPWRVLAEQRAHTADSQKSMSEAERRRVDLTKEKARVEGPIGKEQSARDLGFTKPGEEPVH